LKVKDSLFDGVFNRDFVDYYVDFLRQAMDSIDSLFFYKLEGVKEGALGWNSGGNLQDSRKAQG